jgi:hypothetical protein
MASAEMPPLYVGILLLSLTDFGETIVSDCSSAFGGPAFFDGMFAGAQLIVYDEFNPQESCSFSSLIRLLPSHDIVGFNCEGGYVNQS